MSLTLYKTRLRPLLREILRNVFLLKKSILVKVLLKPVFNRLKVQAFYVATKICQQEWRNRGPKSNQYFFLFHIIAYLNFSNPLIVVKLQSKVLIHLDGDSRFYLHGYSVQASFHYKHFASAQLEMQRNQIVIRTEYSLSSTTKFSHERVWMKPNISIDLS